MTFCDDLFSTLLAEADEFLGGLLHDRSPSLSFVAGKGAAQVTEDVWFSAPKCFRQANRLWPYTYLYYPVLMQNEVASCITLAAHVLNG